MAFLFALILIFFLGWSVPYILSSVGARRWKKEGRLLLEQALIERQRLMQETDILIQEKKKQAVSETDHVHNELSKKQKQILEKETLLKRKEESLDTLAARLEEKRKKTDLRMLEVEEQKASLDQSLLMQTGLSKEEALSEYFLRLKESQKEVFASYKSSIIQELVAEERKRVAQGFDEALHAGYNLVTMETHSISLPLLHDSAIARIIGSNGKNIEGLSHLLGCDLWVDDTKKEILLSSYDDLKRFIGERVLKELIMKDIYTIAQASAIKEKIEATLEQEFILKGKETLASLRLQVSYPDPVLAALGKLELRSSHGQNVLLHSIETANFSKIAATELGLSKELASTMGLFHDIGKILDHTWGTNHPARGKAFLEHYHIDPRICESVGSHHMINGHTSLESMLIPYTDALSARGCAQRLMEQSTPLKRLRQQLEKIPGVRNAWCVDSQKTLSIMLTLKEKSISKEAIESVLCEERVPVPVEVTLCSSPSLPIQTFSFLPTKKS